MRWRGLGVLLRRMKKFLAMLAVVAVAVPVVWSQNVVVNLIAPLEAAAPGGEVRVDLVVLNPTSTEIVFETPYVLPARLTRGTRVWEIELRGQTGGGAQIAARGFSYRSFVFTVPADARGRLTLEVERPLPARAVVDVDRAAVTKPDEEPHVVSAPLSNIMPDQPAETAIQRSFAGRFGANEPVYFIYGSKAPAAKFQFSFKYRVLGDNAALREKVPVLRGMYFGFTQRSLWDIQGDSSPFYDTSYMPELFVQQQNKVKAGGDGGWQWLGYSMGVKHESNGKNGLDSRSLNIAYARTALALGRLDGWNVMVIPRVFAYVGDLRDNPDLADYRGYGDLMLVVGKNGGPALSLTGRVGRSLDRGALQADLTVPLRSDKIFDLATYLIIQYWTGYGESLRDYDKKSQMVRAGFSLVR